jgi:Tol biopolymer transport system component
MCGRMRGIAVLCGLSAVLSVCLSACTGAGSPSVPPIDDGAGPTRITVRFDMSMGADAAARGVTQVVNGVQLESDPLSMNWDGSVLSGDVRVNNVSTGSTMKDIEARIFSISNANIEPNDEEWDYKSAAEGLSSRFVNWAFSGSGGADFEFVVEVSWAPVPAKVAWESYRGGNSEVYVANRDGTNPMNVSNHAADDYAPSLSADGSKVAWYSDRDGNGNSEVYVANTDGTGVVNISNDPAYDYAPSLSADGSKVAWVSYRLGDAEVYVANTNDPGGLVNVSQHGDGDYFPSLSADGSKVAWDSHRHGNAEVYVANTDGTDPKNVSQDSAVDELASLSADGSKVAWESFRNGNWEVYVANTDGSGLVNVSADAGVDTGPSLSADGSKVAWCSPRTGKDEVYVAKADGTGTPVNVSNHSGARDLSPSISADGRTVAWDSDRDGNENVYIASTNGAWPARVTGNEGDHYYASLQGN